MYRALAARANYLSQDRVDIGFVVKELCRNMSKPRQSDWDRLKRLGRYLIDKTRIVNDFHYQEAPDTICVTVDTDHAGCLDTRKSTSGGVVMLGTHCIKTWSTNQQVVATSSGEAGGGSAAPRRPFSKTSRLSPGMSRRKHFSWRCWVRILPWV